MGYGLPGMLSLWPDVISFHLSWLQIWKPEILLTFWNGMLFQAASWYEHAPFYTSFDINMLLFATMCNLLSEPQQIEFLCTMPVYRHLIYSLMSLWSYQPPSNFPSFKTCYRISLAVRPFSHLWDYIEVCSNRTSGTDWDSWH